MALLDYLCPRAFADLQWHYPHFFGEYQANLASLELLAGREAAKAIHNLIQRKACSLSVDEPADAICIALSTAMTARCAAYALRWWMSRCIFITIPQGLQRKPVMAHCHDGKYVQAISCPVGTYCTGNYALQLMLNKQLFCNHIYNQPLQAIEL